MKIKVEIHFIYTIRMNDAILMPNRDTISSGKFWKKKKLFGHLKHPFPNGNFVSWVSIQPQYSNLGARSYH